MEEVGGGRVWERVAMQRERERERERRDDNREGRGEDRMHLVYSLLDSIDTSPVLI